MTKDNGCVGSYHVSGYTRADGTQVSSYTRTCGAAHNSSSNSTSITSKPKLNDKERLKRRAELLYPNTENKEKVKHEFKNVIAVDYIENPALKQYAINKVGKEAAENLHMSKTSSYMNTAYAKEHVIYNNYKEVSSDLQGYFKDKITEQLDLDKVSPELKKEVLDSTKGIFIDAQSESSKKLSKVLTTEPKFLKIYDDSIKKMKKGITIEGNLEFKDVNFHNALGKADIKYMHINRNGDLDLLITDVYDFNPDSKIDLVQVGRERQERGKITPYFIMYHVIIPKNRMIKK